MQAQKSLLGGHATSAMSLFVLRYLDPLYGCPSTHRTMLPATQGEAARTFFNDVFLKVQGITSLHSTVQYGSQGQPIVKEGPRRSCSSLKDSIHLVCQLTEHI